jgi:hypothetical protein
VLVAFVLSNGVKFDLTSTFRPGSTMVPDLARNPTPQREK